MVSLKDIGTHGAFEGIGKTECHMIFQPAEDGVVFDQLLDLQMGKRSVEASKFFDGARLLLSWSVKNYSEKRIDFLQNA